MAVTDHSELGRALDHLWLHFTQMGGYADPADLQVIVKGEGCYLEDADGRRYLDALAECDELLRGFVSPELFKRGLLCRADDRGDPVVQISPPLVAGPEEFEFIASTLAAVLEEAGERMQVAA
jgi:adenosylmethionine-8-amino-7-oxononanoate aminotransferase